MVAAEEISIMKMKLCLPNIQHSSIHTWYFNDYVSNKEIHSHTYVKEVNVRGDGIYMSKFRDESSNDALFFCQGENNVIVNNIKKTHLKCNNNYSSLGSLGVE